MGGQGIQMIQLMQLSCFDPHPLLLRQRSAVKKKMSLQTHGQYVQSSPIGETYADSGRWLEMHDEKKYVNISGVNMVVKITFNCFVIRHRIKMQCFYFGLCSEFVKQHSFAVEQAPPTAGLPPVIVAISKKKCCYHDIPC